MSVYDDAVVVEPASPTAAAADRERAAIEIQRAIRGALARQRVAAAIEQRRTEAVVSLQRIIRGVLARERVATALEQRRAAATLDIQRVMRGALARERVQRRMAAVVAIQSVTRRHLAQREAAERRRARDTRIAAATRLQCVIRSYLARKEAARLQREHEVLLRAVTTIQAVFRGHRGRLVAEERQFLRVIELEQAAEARRQQAAVAIRSAVRAHQARRHYRRLRAAAIVIQRTFRGHRAVLIVELIKFERLRALLEDEERRAATLLQAAWRGYKARLEHDQRVYARQVYIGHVLCVQGAVRSFLALRRLARSRRRRLAAIELQAACRGHLARRRAAELRRERERAAAAVTIQAVLRAALAMEAVAARERAYVASLSGEEQYRYRLRKEAEERAARKKAGVQEEAPARRAMRPRSTSSPRPAQSDPGRPGLDAELVASKMRAQAMREEMELIELRAAAELRATQIRAEAKLAEVRAEVEAARLINDSSRARAGTLAAPSSSPQMPRPRAATAAAGTHTHVAEYGYEAVESGQISIVPGTAVVLVQETKAGWAFVAPSDGRPGARGWIPMDCLVHRDDYVGSEDYV